MIICPSKLQLTRSRTEKALLAQASPLAPACDGGGGAQKNTISVTSNLCPANAERQVKEGFALSGF
jgi:hypothetical protein